MSSFSLLFFVYNIKIITIILEERRKKKYLEFIKKDNLS
jgi:hypothetical protein